MTVLSAIKKAILRTTGTQVAQVFASTEKIAVEMADLSNEVAQDIVKSHDWRALTKIATVVSDGGTVYDLPSDYDRMLLSADVDDAQSWFWGYEPFQSVNDWMRFKAGSYAIVSPGGWIIIGGRLNFYPAPTGNAEFPYVSRNWALSDTDSPKSSFTADNDRFVLDDRLLTLGLIWRWNEQKGFEYGEALETYEKALSQAQTHDKGARLLRTPSRGIRGVRMAYSGRPVG